MENKVFMVQKGIIFVTFMSFLRFLLPIRSSFFSFVSLFYVHLDQYSNSINKVSEFYRYLDKVLVNIKECRESIELYWTTIVSQYHIVAVVTTA